MAPSTQWWKGKERFSLARGHKWLVNSYRASFLIVLPEQEDGTMAKEIQTKKAPCSIQKLTYVSSSMPQASHGYPGNHWGNFW